MDIYSDERKKLWVAATARKLADANILLKDKDYRKHPELFADRKDSSPSRLDCWCGINFAICDVSGHYWKETREIFCEFSGIDSDKLRSSCIKEYRKTGNIDRIVRRITTYLSPTANTQFIAVEDAVDGNS